MPFPHFISCKFGALFSPVVACATLKTKNKNTKIPRMKTPKKLKNLLKNRILAHFSKQLATKSKKYIFSYEIYEFLMFWARNSRIPKQKLEFLSKNH